MNNINLIGRLVRDVETRITQNNKKIGKITLAVYENKEHTNFINCIAFEKTVELLEQYTQKGDKLGIIGKLHIKKGADDKYYTNVIINNISLIDFNKNNNNDDAANFQEFKNFEIEEDVIF